jgi:hypothetical protein
MEVIDQESVACVRSSIKNLLCAGWRTNEFQEFHNYAHKYPFFVVMLSSSLLSKRREYIKSEWLVYLEAFHGFDGKDQVASMSC